MINTMKDDVYNPSGVVTWYGGGGHGAGGPGGRICLPNDLRQHPQPSAPQPAVAQPQQHYHHHATTPDVYKNGYQESVVALSDQHHHYPATTTTTVLRGPYTSTPDGTYGSNNCGTNHASAISHTPNGSGTSPGSAAAGFLDFCRPSVLFSILVCLVIVFLIASGILIYFNYVTHNPRPPLTEDICLGVYCRHGGRCEPWGTTTRCICPTHCPSWDDELPDEVDGAEGAIGEICASDNRTYPGRCEMRRESCLQQREIYYRHAGKCLTASTTATSSSTMSTSSTSSTAISSSTTTSGMERLHPGPSFKAETQDPCISHQCRYGARCVPSLDGLSAQCQCPESCPTFGDHSGSRAVCGSDGVDYPDLCHLNMASCRQSKDIQVKYHGKCDPCGEVTCPGTEVCRLEATTRKPICRCGESCPIEWSPVCASDGKTYANECALKLESCRSGVTLRTVYWGSCDQGVNPCSAVRCAFGETCAIDKSGIARCQCPGGGSVLCPPIIRPVCGTDGRTYDSECELKRTACQQRRDVRLAHPGSCGGKDPCSLNECPHYGICIVRDGKPVCECSIEPCPAEYSPICGSDGITYGNACKLKAHACHNQAKDLQISYDGQCTGCENRPCEFYAVCEASLSQDPGKHGPSNSGRCVCPDRCPEKVNPVCGSDGTTYKNDCVLKMAACRKREHITVAFIGECALCEDVHCLHGAKCKAGHCVCPTNCTITSYSGTPSELVCASNMQTYASECEMQRASCDRLANNPHYEALTVIFYGDCAEREVAALGNPPTLTTITPGIIPHFAPGPPPGAVTVRPLNPDESPGYSHLHPRPTINSNPVNHRGSGTSLLRKVAELNSIMEKNEKKSEAEIEACRDIHCDFSATCELGEDKLPRCSCKFNCIDIPSSPSSPFELETIPIGSLSTSDRRAYRAGYRPLGSYFYHHREPTNMRKRRRKRNSKREAVTSWHRGPTIEGRLHREMPTLTVQPVCGSDLKIYPSECALRMEACQRQEELRLRPFQLCQGMEVKPCKGEEPLKDSLTDQELHCGSGPRRQDCPAHSYCHQTQQFAKCCPKEIIPISCDTTVYGCCSDGKTAAMGLDQQGCPTNCGCNRLGSYDDTCDAETGQCHCRPGVGGLKCDRCLPGYWGLPKISEGHQGCMPCACSEYGAVREDCEQMTGRCVCKQGIQGQKCTECIGYRKILGPYGCRDSESNLPSGANCQEITCHYGSICREDISIPGSSARAQCTCPMDCVRDRDPIMQVVCGNDGQTYASECELKLNSCRQQKEIGIRSHGPCSDLGYGVTEWPEKRSTALRYTEPEDVSSPQYKSTRHLLVPEIIERPISGLSDPYRLGGNHNRGNGFNDINEVRLTSASLHHTRNSLNDVLYASGIRPTPATVRMVTALVGDLCVEDEDCRQVANAICIRGGCRCRDTFRESHDRSKCLAESETDSHIHHTNEENENHPHHHINSVEGSCTDEPCQNEGVCREATKSGHITCFCHGHWTGLLCETPLIPRAYDIPAFDGRSYVQLKRLHAYSKLSIEIEFKTYAKDGILLYNEQREDGMGDFVSLAVINGFVEFRYNLGNGPVIIRSTERVEPKRFHRIVAKRYHRDGMLKLDDSEDIAGQSQGSLKSLDLMLDAFVGYVPTNYSRVYENIGTSHGLMGCIRRLRVGRHTVDLHEGLDLMVERARGIRECGENPCSSLPCQHGGQCEPIRADTFRCTCAPQFTGTVCESRLDPCLSSPCVHGATCESLPHGTYVCKCPPGRKGNRCHELDAELQESFVAQFDVDSWMELPKLEHVGRAFSIELWLKLDGIVNNNLISNENESSSDTRETCILYSGPMRGWSPFTTPLAPDQQHSTAAFSTTTSATPTVMFMAMLADDHHVLSTPSQAQESYPLLSSTSSPQPPPPPPPPPKPTGGDFISLTIDTNGVLRFAFDLGSGPANISWPHPLPMDRWISVKLTRLNQEGSLLVLDGNVPSPEPVHGRSQPPLNELNLEHPLYLGKPPHHSNWSGFRGSLQRLIINGHSVRGLSPNYVPPPVSASVHSAVFSQRFSIEQYSGHPCPIDDNSPCLNGGVCVPMLEKYVCQCPLRFNGTHCQHLVDYISSTIPIKFTGDTFYQYPNKIRKSSGLTNITNINATNDSTTTSLDGLESMNLDEIAGNEGESNDNGENYDDIEDEDDDEEEEEEEDEEELDDFLEEEDILEITQDDMDFLDGRKGERTNRYELRMRTNEPNGLIIWRSRGRSLQQDYLSLAIVNGFVEASLNLGKQEELLLVRSKVYIADGQWHEVLVSRVKRQLWLKVDAEQPVRGLAARGATLLKTNKRLWIGGAPTLPSGLPAAYYMGYKGCLDAVRVGRKTLDLIQHRISTGGSTAVQYCHENAV